MRVNEAKRPNERDVMHINIGNRISLSLLFLLIGWGEIGFMFMCIVRSEWVSAVLVATWVGKGKGSAIWQTLSLWGLLTALGG